MLADDPLIKKAASDGVGLLGTTWVASGEMEGRPMYLSLFGEETQIAWSGKEWQLQSKSGAEVQVQYRSEAQSAVAPEGVWVSTSDSPLQVFISDENSMPAPGPVAYCATRSC